MLSRLKIDTGCLRSLAADCQSWAAEVEMTSASESVGRECQASAVAVAAVNMGLGVAAQSMVSRMRSTAAQLVIASIDYAVNDEASAAQMSALTTDM